MPHSDGRLCLFVPQHRPWRVPALALLILALAGSAWSQGFPEGHHGAFGPLYSPHR